MNIAILGGSFNPIHQGHVLNALYLLNQGFDKVFIVPCFNHPYGKNLLNFNLRMKLCSLAFEKFSNYISVLDVESKLPVPSFTYRTVDHIKFTNKNSNLRLILGSDLINSFESWEGSDIIQNLAPPYFIGRAGYLHEKAPIQILPEISSTRIKELLKTDPASEELVKLMPDNVLEFILVNNLYGKNNLYGM